ncbi:hypothetical protein EDD86DRAFT_278047 [Gorgonomyces haynaldii]|nr:hypothetical protein EDD86DRAFT_278047 [Gorgonomyces haynaldii]
MASNPVLPDIEAPEERRSRSVSIDESSVAAQAALEMRENRSNSSRSLRFLSTRESENRVPSMILEEGYSEPPPQPRRKSIIKRLSDTQPPSIRIETLNIKGEAESRRNSAANELKPKMTVAIALDASDSSDDEDKPSKGGMSSKSGDSSEKSDEPDIFQRYVAGPLEKFLESEMGRKLLKFLGSYKIIVLLVFAFFLVQMVLFLYILDIVDGLVLKNKYMFNLIHILFNWIGHVPQMATDFLVSAIHKLLMSSMLAHQGVKMKALYSGPLSRDVAGYWIRRLLHGIGSTITLLMALVAFYFEWEPVSSLLTTDSCIPVNYKDPPVFFVEPDNFLQGQVDQALIYNYGIPTIDGMVGGMGAWPGLAPAPEFSVTNDGEAFIVFANCMSPVIAPTPTNFTRISLVQSYWRDQFVQGTLEIQVPPGTMKFDGNPTFNTSQDTTGYKQICSFEVGFGGAVVEYSFISDVWYMITISSVVQVKIGQYAISAGNNQVSYAQLKKALVKDVLDEDYLLAEGFYNMTSMIYQGNDCRIGKESKTCNTLHWAVNPDGYYHDQDMWRGVASSVASAAHYLQMQFDGDEEGMCDYYASHGAGKIVLLGPWVTITSWVCYIISGSLLLHIWWAFLAFDIDEATDMAGRSLTSPLRLVYDMHLQSEDIFVESQANVNMLTADVFKKTGSRKLIYGVPYGELDNPSPNFVIGKKGTIMVLKRYVMRQQSKMDKIVTKDYKTQNSMSMKSISNDNMESSASQKIDDNDSVHSEETKKNIFLRIWEILVEAYDHPRSRAFRLFLHSYKFIVFSKLFFVVILLSTVIGMTFLFQGRQLPSQNLYNFIQICYILIGQLVCFVTISLLKSLHQLILSSLLSHKGIKIKELFSSYLSSKGPAFGVRRFLAVLAFALPVTMSVGAYFFEWHQVETSMGELDCVSASYLDPPIFLPDTGNYLQGAIDFGSIYTFGIPLQDGIVGGWSAWPEKNPDMKFSISEEGYGYAIRAHCFKPTAARVPHEGTRLILTNHTLNDLSLSGYLTVYIPPDTMELDGGLKIDGKNGFEHLCNFEITFTKANVRYQFLGDEWEGLVGKKLLEMTVGKKSITLDNISQFYYGEFMPQVEDPELPFSTWYLDLLHEIFAGQDYLSTQGAVPCNLLSFTTRWDGMYHSSAITPGVLAAMAEAAHFILLQYDAHATDKCEYFHYAGAGLLNATGPWLYLAIAEAAILLVGLILHIWWIYLIYKIDHACDQALPAIDSPVRCAHDMNMQTSLIFGPEGSKFDTLNRDIEKRHGDTTVLYGAMTSSMGNGLPIFGIGLKRKTIPIHKLIKKKK